MDAFKDFSGVGPDEHIAYLVRQGSCTQEKLQNAADGLIGIAEKCNMEQLKALAKVGAVQPLVLMLSHRMAHQALSREKAAICLNILAKHEDLRVSIVQQKLLPSVAKWCEEGTPGLQLAIGLLLGSLAQDPDNQAIIHQQGLSPVILAMGTPACTFDLGEQLTGPSGPLRAALCRLIAQLALNSTCQLELVELGALAFLLKQAIILGPPPAPPPDEWIAAERLRISELPEGSEQQMLAGENLEEELKPKQGPPAVEVRREACRGLWNMAAYSVNQTKLSELGAIEVLLKLLREEEAPEAVRIQASGALSNLCLNEEIALAVSEQNGAEDMMVLCVSGVNALEKNGAAGLSNMCNLPSVREEMVEYGGAPIMVNILQKASDKGDKEMQKCACGALMNLALHPPHRKEILANDGVPLLLKVTDHEDTVNNAAVQEPAAGCLALMAWDVEAQKMIVQHDGLTMLVKLANSPHIPVMLTAAEALDKFVANDKYRDLLTSAGGVDVLQLYARKMITERSKRGKPQVRPKRPFEKQPRVSATRGSTLRGPPPRYRPITPGPLYEAEALSWWPGTEERPLSRGDSHPHKRSSESTRRPQSWSRDDSSDDSSQTCSSDNG